MVAGDSLFVFTCERRRDVSNTSVVVDVAVVDVAAVVAVVAVAARYVKVPVKNARVGLITTEITQRRIPLILVVAFGACISWSALGPSAPLRSVPNV